MGAARTTVRRTLIFAAIITNVISSAGAHDLFAEYIQHHVKLSVSAGYVDVIVELKFFEDWSAQERQRMDKDRDGRIQRVELENYTSNLATNLDTRVGLLIGGPRVALALLYAPEVDLLGRETVGRGHHRLTLHFFAPTPGGLAAGTEVIVENRLWPEARAVGVFQAVGVGKRLLKADGPKVPVFSPTHANEVWRFKARYLEDPAAGGGSASPPSKSG